MVAAILGDTVNYWIGYTFELKILEWKYSLVRKEHLAETHEYFEKYGGLTIFIARFVPFIRTFAPFLAGVGKMRYPWFLGYNILGGVAWVSAFLLTGYFFGNLAIVQQNFSLVTYTIIGLSFDRARFGLYPDLPIDEGRAGHHDKMMPVGITGQFSGNFFTGVTLQTIMMPHGCSGPVGSHRGRM